ncbi:hypothetical protein CR62_16635 [Serratia grimesii]|uniref:Uncharacterized protein n=1 Tax=Serratia grimesii TaxID=82995 RepID=A0ABR4UDU9_9GAMM|nr:hypothetical protein CR62_16635 [Serratia grimesii]
MAKRKSNRAARHLLAQGKDAQIYRISNRRQMNQIFDDQPGFAWQTKPSARQRRNDKRRFEWLRENASTDCDYIGIADHNPQFHC